MPFLFYIWLAKALFLATASPRQNPDQVFCQDASAGESRPLPHQMEERIFAIAANQGDIPQVNDQLASFKLFLSVAPRPLHFLRPRGDELPLKYQLSAAVRFHCGELKHLQLGYSTQLAKEKRSGYDYK